MNSTPHSFLCFCIERFQTIFDPQAFKEWLSNLVLKIVYNFSCDQLEKTTSSLISSFIAGFFWEKKKKLYAI